MTDLADMQARLEALERALGKIVSRQTPGVGSSTVLRVAQSTHGFVVGDVLRLSGSTYAKAQANTTANMQVVGVVAAVLNPDAFILATGGMVSGLSGRAPGTRYYLSATIAGTVTAVAPTDPIPIYDAVTSTAAIICPVTGPLLSLGTGTARSVLGVAGAANAARADIIASINRQVVQYNGTSLGWRFPNHDAFGYQSHTLVTSTGAITLDTTTGRRVRFYLIGGGGGGGSGSTSYVGGGGAHGGVCVTPWYWCGQDITSASVGAIGAGGAAGAPGDGGDGGSTSLTIDGVTFASGYGTRGTQASASAAGTPGTTILNGSAAKPTAWMLGANGWGRLGGSGLFSEAWDGSIQRGEGGNGGNTGSGFGSAGKAGCVIVVYSD